MINDEDGAIDGSQSPLARWSARKQQARQVGHPVAEDSHATENHSANAPETTPKDESETESNDLTDKDMIDLERIDQSTDMSGFFSPKVSQALRQKALRRLFSLPIYNIRDGLNDYDEDYTQFEKLAPGTITSDMRHQMEMAERKKAEAEAQAQAQTEPLTSPPDESPITRTTIDHDTTGSEQPDEAPAPAREFTSRDNTAPASAVESPAKTDQRPTQGDSEIT